MPSNASSNSSERKPRDPVTCCPDCVEALAHLGVQVEHGATFVLSRDLRFHEHISRTTVWHKGDQLCLESWWTEAAPHHARVVNVMRKRGVIYKLLCTRGLKDALRPMGTTQSRAVY
jgi:hypothetical protein